MRRSTNHSLLLISVAALVGSVVAPMTAWPEAH